MSSRTDYRTNRTNRLDQNHRASFSFRKVICTTAYAYQRRRKIRQIKKYIRKTNRHCVYALRDLTACHLDNKKDVIMRAEMKYEKAAAVHRRCADLISQCSAKYHSPSDIRWLHNFIQLHAGYTVALQYVRCIVFDKLMPVQRAYYAGKGLKFLKMYRDTL
jgi:hypothetical protein